MKARKLGYLAGVGMALALATGANAQNTVMTGARYDVESGNTRQETIMTLDNGKVWAKMTNPIGEGMTDAANSDIMVLVGAKHKIGFRTGLDGNGVALTGLGVGPMVGNPDKAAVQTYGIGLAFDGMTVGVAGMTLVTPNKYLNGLTAEVSGVVANGAVQDISAEIIQGVNVTGSTKIQGTIVVGNNGLRDASVSVQRTF